MSRQPWASKSTLRTAEQVTGFECGRDSVDQWLHDKAVQARPHVLTTLYLDADGEVMAFAATTMMILAVEGGTSAQRAGSRDGQSVGFLLAQMGVRKDLSGRGIGKAVVRGVMMAASRAGKEAPFPLFVVDAADESLISYYEALGLRRLKNQLRLATPMRQITRIIDSTSPQAAS
ncbi:MAG: hypothetical protein LBO20_05895 [Bifidobacteriaceae bacterium]|nr:hypothetical protein [Bifidobacteriaceae bacterium]